MSHFFAKLQYIFCWKKLFIMCTDAINNNMGHLNTLCIDEQKERNLILQKKMT